MDQAPPPPSPARPEAEPPGEQPEPPARRPRDWRESLRRLAARMAPHRWGLLMIGACAITYLSIYAADPRAQQPDGDGFYGWLYARSLVFDGDIHFANDYRLCGDPWHNAIDRGVVPGRPDNPFYLGPSLFWIPALWLLKHVVPLPSGAPPAVLAGCSGPLPGLTLGLAPLLGALAIGLSYRVARRVSSDGQAALAAGLIAVGGSIAAYATVVPSYSHIYATACTAFLVWTAVRASERPDSWRRWWLTALALCLCVFQRFNFASMALIPAALAARHFWGRWPALVGRLALLAAAAIVGAVPTLLVYRYLYGTIFRLPQGRYYVQIGHGHPLLLLFSPIYGLFFMTPAMWLAVLGIPSGLGRRPWLIGAALLTMSLEIYISSCPIIWDAGSTFGARLLTPLTPLLILLAAFAIARAHAWLAVRPSRALVALGATLLVPVGFMTVGMVTGIHSHRILSGFTQEGAYGGGVAHSWWGIDQGIGDLAVLPAEIPFAWRYGLPRQSFRQATYPRTFMRDYKTMRLSADVIHFSDAEVAPLLRGFGAAPGGARIAAKAGERRAAVVFSASWPYATRLSVAARASRPTRLKVGLGRFYGPLWLGEAALGPSVAEPWPAFALPRGSFDSGLNEIVFECIPAPCQEVVVEAVRLHDDNNYGPSLR